MYPYFVQIAWDTIERFITDWRKDPYRWSREIDIQMELTSRLCNVLKTIGKNTVIGNYSDSKIEGDQRWNRVCCEPTIRLKDDHGEPYTCIPDIVMWKDIKDEDNPPDEEEVANWPMLWVCEIKLDTINHDEWDLEKMRSLLLQNDVEYACWLTFFRKQIDGKEKIQWENELNNRLWVCKVFL